MHNFKIMEQNWVDIYTLESNDEIRKFVLTFNETFFENCKMAKSSFKTMVWEDNMGCLKLAKLAPGQYTPRSKHYAVKYHLFRSKLQETRTTIKHIKSKLQKADLLTKGLPAQTFKKIRKLLMGW
jgi:hypothetical protein